MEHVISAATDILDRHWDMTLPVTLTAVAYSMGVSIRFDPCMESGTVASDEKGTPVVFLNPRDTAVQQRFATGRALGEIVLSERAGEGDPSLSEMECFAAEMILPRKAVTLYATNRMPISQMAALFGVTDTAMRIRLGRMGFDG